MKREKMKDQTYQLSKWIGKFGKSYTSRNAQTLQEMDKLYLKNYGVTRSCMNKLFLSKMDRSIRILEIGSNIGLQLGLLQRMGFKNLYGIEPQSEAVETSKHRLKNINIIEGNIFEIPFRDRFFDLVFTSGVLIHIHPKQLTKAIKEIGRCAKKYIWGFEYFSNNFEEIQYRKHKNLLWKGNYPEIYSKTFPSLKLIKTQKFRYLEHPNTDIMFLFRK